MSRQLLIVGCGYIGLPLALRFQAQGDTVAGWVRSEGSAKELKGQLNQLVIGSVGDEKIWRSLKGKFDLVIHCASSGGGGAPAYEEVFLEGVRQMNRHQPQAQRLFVSSTSVYGQLSGEVVTEKSPAEPSTTTSQILCRAEKEASASGVTVVRPSGVYGPNRGVLFEKFIRNEAVIEGDGSRWLNQIHRDDLVAALIHLSERTPSPDIYNATDDEPVTLRDFYAWCGQFLGKPLPPFGPVNLQRKRGSTNKRVSNAKLRDTGWQPRYPTFREGLSVGYSPK